VGRVPPADVVVPDESLSRQHARFTRTDDGVTLEDLGSTNGSWLGGENVTTATLKPGDVVLLGDVSAVVQELGLGAHLGLSGHERFVALLDAEVRRARHFGRPVAVAMVTGAHKEPLHAWHESVTASLRPVDSMALYSSSTLEILMPEMDGPGALRLIEGIATRTKQPLHAAVASFPVGGTTVDVLLQACRTALFLTSSHHPIRMAPSVGISESVREEGLTASGLIAESEAMREVLDMARRVARGTIPVFLRGETGTGKEVVARFIHAMGPRSERPLVTVNCAAIPPQLVEGTLFGHVKGAFTGASANHAGVFEAANTGTVLLDEVGELPPAAQAALLRVLEAKTVTRVGSTKETAVDVRIIAATHRDLEAMSARGEFREDLFYRLNAVTIDIPPLRDRRADILPLVDHFLAQARGQNEGSDVEGLAPEAGLALASYDWPGNIRELRNAVERAVVIAEHSVIGLRDLPRKVRDSHGGSADPPPVRVVSRRLRGEEEGFRACIERLESEIILEALEDCGGNQSEVARRLDIPRRTLVHKIKVLGIKRGGFDRR
jgi:DNA-binding NtrC family response regulator